MAKVKIKHSITECITFLDIITMALTQERAELRSNSIRKGSIFYHFHVYLQRGDNYQGYAEITFDLLYAPNELVIDFKGKEVTKLIQNGEIIQPKLVDGFIVLELQKLRVGKNAVGIHYACNYDNDGSGCVSFVDVDSKQYVYTQFAPYYANRVFPCFDQPDLKAKMQLSVICPSDWKKVLSNEHPILEKEFDCEEYIKFRKSGFQGELESYLKDKNGKVTIFPETKLLPTYLIGFIAGEYLQLKLPKQKQYKNVPMSLYCIESLFGYMKDLSDFIFQITIESMKFYQSYFAYPFPFNKYDQIFAHEYKWGAMENAGAVTFNDRYIFKEKVSTERMLSLANTIAHELSHHWFGNLVTMKWWDDVWLNESFADFISHFCLDKLKGTLKTISYQSSMAAFLQRKGWGYHEDQMITTHPIRGKVENTTVADSIFDGITYSKGAATMKQLLYLVDEDNFGKALSEYFHKHEWSNATIEDFLSEMQKRFKVTEFTLKEWKSSWLEKPSLNIIEAVWNPEDFSYNAKMKIKQQFLTNDYPTLRFHKIKIGLFLDNLDVDSLEVLILPQKETIVQYNGSKQYKAVLLNYEDHTFVKNTIDPVSLEFFIKNINSIKDLLSRTLIWRSFFEMVKDAKMTSHKFVEVVTTALAFQSSDSLFEKQFDFVYSSINTYTPEKLRKELNCRMFKFVYHLLAQIPADKHNRITILKSNLVNFAKTEEEIDLLLQWRDNEEEQLKGKEMTVGQKWSTAVKAFTLSSLSLEQKEAIFESQRAEDPSDTAKKYRCTCDSLKSTEEEFQAIYEGFKAKDSKNSVALKEFISAGWNHSYHKERLKKYMERYFKDIEQLIDVLSSDHFKVFYEHLAPIDDDLEFQLSRYEKISFPQGKEFPRGILKIMDNLKRRIKAYQLYKGEE